MVLALRAGLRPFGAAPAALVAKSTQKHCSASPPSRSEGALRSSPKQGRPVNSRLPVAQTTVRLVPVSAAVLGGSEVAVGGHWSDLPSNCRRAHQPPLTQPSIAGTGGVKRGVSERSAIASSRAPPGPRSAGHQLRSNWQVAGCPFFGLRFFGQAKKGNVGALHPAQSNLNRRVAAQLIQERNLGKLKVPRRRGAISPDLK